MPKSDTPSVNSWLEDELYQQYRYDHNTVDPSWAPLFETNGHTVKEASGAVAVPAPTAQETPVVPVSPGDQLVPLRGPALRIAENMTASLTIPVATSQRVMPVKVIEENRRLINQHRSLEGATKLSYTHMIAWAIVKAIGDVPALNQAYSEQGAESFRVARRHVNLGIAVDVAGKDGVRALKVPSIKSAEAMNFAEFLAAYDDLVARTRANKLQVADFEGTTISLTNPGTVGTMGSNPRLMPGQGAIIATGAIDYPPEYRGVPEDTRTSMGLSKVMTVTCTYDHRVIQGAESGAFLGRLQALLEGEDNFYEGIFQDLGVPLRPLRWEADQASAPVINADPMKQAAVARLIQAWRERGHLISDLDPLGPARPPHPDLEPASHGLTIWDLDRTFQAGSFGVTTLRALIDRLRLTYAGTMGVQYMHIENPEERTWLQQRMEPAANRWPLDVATRKRILKDVIEAEGFELFLDTRFKGHKRFSIEGGESMLAMIVELLERGAAAGVRECVVGMSHRGRLSTLANIVGKSMVQLFSEFDGGGDPESFEGQGDVKYHLGASGVWRASSGQDITISVAFNPSHLEAVNPVAEGLTRPKQDRLGDRDRSLVIPLLIHGDAAMAGQGVVAETMNLSRVAGYDTGGTVHIVVNNQIGFTTNPEAGRSSTYCTDVALAYGCPVFHVNGDDPEACVRSIELAYDYRQRFHKDVVIDMWCYRKYGHNEADDPSYTQPVVYRKIRAHKPVTAIYAERLEQEGLINAREVKAFSDAQKQRFNAMYEEAQSHKQNYELQELSAIPAAAIPMDHPPEAVDRAMLERIVERITQFPADFHLHPKLTTFIKRRRETFATGAHIDWALAEVLAFGSLVAEGTPVRLSGEDSGRGTFSQRHVEYHDYENDRVYVPLQHLSEDQARFEVYNSPLSEFAVLGFEFGYSVADPLTLVLWEAQFGDFANGAQVIIDQFLVAAESKWGQPSGLVLLLPHGQEGQGPEHSSARLERFLQLCSENNLRVANCTTPAQYFHLLRRQMCGGEDRRGLRKPLVVMTPKSLLRHPKVVSTVDELTRGVFQPLLDDATIGDASAVRKILVCSGKIYYDLAAARDERRAADTAIIRIEQLYPFPEAEFAEMLAKYPAAGEVVWVQEEPRNSGAWAFVRGWIQPTVQAQHRQIGYAGRPESASTAPGSLKRHQQEQAELIEQAFRPPTVERTSWKRLRRLKNR
ncbi:MAG TPA: multifunctional oxoglutarate decarboxylase/oxoglutarate dehydrogenase thiamine pyrophosphate-binding subunit/dihydrolipoyllysine-residue succinyltransferase subunit [Bryobacteraceae bacterium]|nr:multifunctional oxoglutarate decarboxylase/oxoglutarate dehydrogenase thiamine pyrophosphate-binding subunit/dihydrolipoyllysine-residue succinyltransferase subunit [Bryobacteraceae bacterium]